MSFLVRSGKCYDFYLSRASILFCLILPSLAAAIIAPPSSSVKFHCQGTGDTLTWLVDAIILTETIKKEREVTISDMSNNNGTVSSTLTIATIPANDGLEIGCIIVFQNPFHVTLYQDYSLDIRGISPVEDLNLNFTSNTSLLSWSPPAYHSNDVTLDFYTYEVVVTYADSELVIAVNTTTLELANVTMCDTFNVSVTALLAQYRSIAANKEHNGNSSSLNFTTKGCEIVIELISLPICQFILYVSNNNDNDILMQELILGSNPISYILSPHESYQLFVQVQNLRNEIQDELQTNISTYFVQNFSIAKNWDNGSVTIALQVMINIYTSCMLIMPKLYVVFDEKTQRLKESFNFTSEGKRLVTLSMSGNYSVSVFDIDNGSIFGPAFELQEVQIDIPTTEPVHSITYSMSVTPTITPTSAVSPKSSTLTIHAIVWSICFIVILSLVIFLSVSICYQRKSVIKSMCTTIQQRVLNKKSDLNYSTGFFKPKQDS